MVDVQYSLRDSECVYRALYRQLKKSSIQLTSEILEMMMSVRVSMSSKPEP